MVKMLLKLSCFASLLLTADLAKGQTKHTIQVADNSFNPSSFVANVGDTVQWVFIPGSMEIHTTTSTSIPSGAASWDQPVNTANPTFDYIITEAGSYDYVCTPHASMGMTGSFTATSPTSVPKVHTAMASIVPNPAKNAITISAIVNDLNIYITDMQGRIVKSWAKQEGNTTVDISSIPPGIYTITLQKDHLLQKEKLIIE